MDAWLMAVQLWTDVIKATVGPQPAGLPAAIAVAARPIQPASPSAQPSALGPLVHQRFSRFPWSCSGQPSPLTTPTPTPVCTPSYRPSPALLATEARLSHLGTAAPVWASGLRPRNGGQLYRFRQASLAAGEMFTRAQPHRYVHQWQRETESPTRQQWQQLLTREATVMAAAQGQNRLTIILGDSLALWLPSEYLPRHQFWLNQSISGETTGHMLQRLHYFADTRPDTIHLMAGINDLRNGASDGDVVHNINQMLLQLRQQHPQARVVVHSILPTRLANLPRDRIAQLNQYLAYVANQRGAEFIDLQSTFADHQGQLRRELTTDGLHLSPSGYEVWQAAMVYP
jgi:lysophospholipase L1-like esterase